MKGTTSKRSSQPHVIVIQGGKQAQAIIKSLELSKGAKPMTVKDAIELWTAWLRKNAKGNSADQSISYINAWARDSKVETMPLDDVEEEHINEWVNANDGTKLGTRRVRLAIVRSFFKFLAIKEVLSGSNPSTLAHVDFNSLSHQQKESKELVPFTPAEFDKLIDHLDAELEELQPKIQEATSKVVTKKLFKKRDYLLFWKSAAVISRCTGLRFGDVCQLEWATLEKQFTVWTDKRNKRVQPYIWNRELFDETVAQIPTDYAHMWGYCFPIQREIYLDSKRRPGLNVQFSRLCEKLGMNHTFHELRHTYATECDKAGIPTPHIAKSMGHSSTETTEGYIH